MMEGELRLLIIEDSEDDALLLVRELRREGIAPVYERVETAEAMREALRRQSWDLVISDYVMPGFSGLAALGLMKESGADLPFIIISGRIGEDAAVEAMKAGAHDYILKGSLKRLIPAIERELREAGVRRERRLAGEALRRAKDELEERVTERTAELLRIKEELEAEILERRRNEETLDRTLREKETLLRELYHRTKNNMNVISGLLSLQAASLRDSESRQTFREMQDRIRSMALVHQKLYQSGDLSEISLGEYLRELAQTLLESYRVGRDSIGVRIEAENISVSIDTATPCGLVINELMTNSLKYAFPDRGGEIGIEVRKADDGVIRIRYSDNGVGMPEGIDLKTTRTLGLRLVRRLVEGQLGGSVELRREAGTEFILTFLEPYYKPRI